MSLFSFKHKGLNGFVKKMETLNLMGKVMLIIPDTRVRVYSSAGIANVHRQDMIMDDWRLIRLWRGLKLPCYGSPDG